MMSKKRLAEVDPENRAAHPRGDAATGGGPGAHRERELRLARGPRGAGLVAHEQVRRGLPREALLRRLRGRRSGRAARDRPREGALRRRARERPAALRLPGQHGGLLRARHELGRQRGGWADRGHAPRHEPQLRGPPHPRLVRQLLREALQESCRTGSPARPRPSTWRRSGSSRGSTGRRSSWSARAPIRGRSTSTSSPRSRERSARPWSSTWRTSRASSRRASTRTPSRSRTSSRRPPTRRSAARAAG